MSAPDPPLDPLTVELLATVREPLVVLDAGRRVVAFTPAFARQFAGTAEGLTGRSIYELDGGAWSNPAVRAVLEDLAPRSEEIGEREVELGPPGAGTLVQLHVRPIRSGANRIERLLVSVSETRAGPTGAAADDLDRDVALAGWHTSDVLALYRGDGRCVYVGDGCETVLGYTREEWVRHRACTLVHPAERELVEGLLAHARSAGSQRLQLRVRRWQGEYAWMDVALRLVDHPRHGALVQLTARDVTQQKRAEDALRWLGRQTRLILDSTHEGIFGIDTQGQVTFANAAACRYLGRDASELMGGPYRSFVKVPAGEVDEIADTVAAGEPRTGERVLLRRDGGELRAELTCSPARLHDEVVGAVITFRDASDRRRADEAMRRAEWLAGVAQTAIALRHEINNPLTSMIAELSLLEMGGNSPEEEREMIASVAGEARRIRDILRRLAERQSDPTVLGGPLGSMLDLSGG